MLDNWRHGETMKTNWDNWRQFETAEDKLKQTKMSLSNVFKTQQKTLKYFTKCQLFVPIRFFPFHRPNWIQNRLRWDKTETKKKKLANQFGVKSIWEGDIKLHVFFMYREISTTLGRMLYRARCFGHRYLGINHAPDLHNCTVKGCLAQRFLMLHSSLRGGSECFGGIGLFHYANLRGGGGKPPKL